MFFNSARNNAEKVLVKENQEKSQQDSEIYYINDSDLNLSKEELERLTKLREEASKKWTEVLRNTGLYH